MVARVELSKYRKRAVEVALAWSRGELWRMSFTTVITASQPTPPLKLPNLEIRVSLNKPLLNPKFLRGGTLVGKVDGPPSTSTFKFSSLQVWLPSLSLLCPQRERGHGISSSHSYTSQTYGQERCVCSCCVFHKKTISNYIVHKESERFGNQIIFAPFVSFK